MSHTDHMYKIFSTLLLATKLNKYMHKHFLYFLHSFAIIGRVQTFNVENQTINTKIEQIKC